jgi:predicted secreted hydrolase
VPPPPGAEPTPAPRPISIPDDEGRHSNSLEWWYYHGHLNSPGTGEEFGFHFVIFQSRSHQDQGGVTTYASQLGVTDVRQSRHVQSARIGVGEQPVGANLVDLNVGGWSLSIDGSGHTIAAAEGPQAQFGVDLRLERPAAPMLHNGIGWIGGPSGWTYYYSWPRMPAEGTVTLEGRTVPVTGEVWMDHQWGDFFVLGYPAGWQWFAIQLDDGSSLMLQEFRDIEGKPVAAFGTFAGADGIPASQTLLPDQYSVQVLDRWRSPNTGAEYPSRWAVNVRAPQLGLDLLIEPVAADQEITRGVPPAAIYWEGKSIVRDGTTGQVVGRAYVELTGYVNPPGPQWMADPK